MCLLLTPLAERGEVDFGQTLVQLRREEVWVPFPAFKYSRWTGLAALTSR
jgi:hypothetical protein